jgi:hypothetical protein
MAAPTFIQHVETSWTAQTGVTKTTASFDVQAGDVLVAYGMVENILVPITGVSGGSLTWTLQPSNSANSSDVWQAAWTATVDSDKTMTVAATKSSGTSVSFGLGVLTFRNSNGIGNIVANVGGSAPSVNLTTTQTNSAIVTVNGDFSATDGSTRAWATTAGSFTEETYDLESGVATYYAGFYPNVGAVGSKTVGMSTPASQAWALIAVEVLGATSPRIETINDDFNDNSMDTTLWTTINGSGTVSETSGRLSIAPASSFVGLDYQGYSSIRQYNLTGSQITIQLIQGMGTNAGDEQMFGAIMDDNNGIYWMITDSRYTYRHQIAGTNVDVHTTSRNDPANAFWRIREKSGIIYWDVSSDAVTWSNVRTSLVQFDITSLTVIIKAGTWQSVAIPGTAIFDNFNTINTAGVGWLGA